MVVVVGVVGVCVCVCVCVHMCVCTCVCTRVWLSLRAEREAALPSNQVVAVVVQLLSHV